MRALLQLSKNTFLQSSKRNFSAMAERQSPINDPFEEFDRLGEELQKATSRLFGGIGTISQSNKQQKRPSSSMPDFREHVGKANHIVIITGAGVSAESGVPTFRGAGGFWRKWQAQELATPEAFEHNPSLVWEFYHYRREVMRTKEPNKAHLAIAEFEKRLAKQGRHVAVVTQNIDELHRRAGTENMYELHGSLFRVRCLGCKKITSNKESPICEALAGKGEPTPEAKDAQIPAEKLPRCKDCGGLLRPDVVWFGEGLDPKVLHGAQDELDKCDLCLVVGTSSVVYPAAMFAPEVARRGVPVAEFNMEETPATSSFGFHFQGPAGTLIPEALAPHTSELSS